MFEVHKLICFPLNSGWIENYVNKNEKIAVLKTKTDIQNDRSEDLNIDQLWLRFLNILKIHANVFGTDDPD